jgi:anti-sigma regulatory factor (Ser/Thr protein kinase)
MALDEAVSNAMIHGNLEVGSAVRDQGGEAYYRLIRERGATSPYAERRVHLTARESAERVDYVIEDDGPGFDVASLSRAVEPDNLLRVRGRGLILIRAFMDAVVHNARGNQITLTKHGTTRPIALSVPR